MSRYDIKKASFKGWWVCSLAAMFYAYEYLLRIEPNVMEHALRQRFNLDAGSFGWLLASYFYAYTPLQLVVGVMLDRFGCHKVLSMALITCVGGCALFAGGHSIWLMVFGRWLLGVGSAFAFIGILRIGALWLPARQFSLYVGLTTALGMVGAIFGDIALTHVVHKFGWSPALYFSAFLGLVMVPFFIVFVREPKLGNRQKPGILKFSAIKQFLFSPTFWALGFVAFALYASLSVVAGVWGIPWLEAKYAQNTAWATHEITAIFAGWLVGSPLFGWWSAKIRARKKLLLLGISVAIICYILLLLDVRYSDLLLWIILFTFGLSCSAEVLCFAIVSDWVSRTTIATALALMNFMAMLSGMMLQPFVAQTLSWGWQGKSLDGVHIYSNHGFTISMSVVLLCLLLALFVMTKIPESFRKKARR